MLIRLRRWASVATLSLMAVGLCAACGQLVPMISSNTDPDNVAPSAQVAPAVARSASYATPSSTTRARVSSTRLVPVKRDSLTETLSLDGVVAPQDQVSVTYPQRALVDWVQVKAGQSVKQGDLLVDVNGADISRGLDAARAHLQLSQTNLDQGRASLQAAAQRAVADQQQRQQAVDDAQVGVRSAQDNLKTVQAGKSASDKDAQVTAVSAYGIAVRQAQDSLDNVLAGPTPETIRAAQREVSADEATLTKAQTDLDALTRGPDADAVRTTQSVLQRAQTQLQLAQAAKIDPKAPDQAVASLQHDAAIQDAQMGLQAAQAALTKLKQPPSDSDVSAARQRVQDAQDILDTAQAKLTTLQAGPDPQAVTSAQTTLERAKHAAAEAQANLDEVTSHPTQGELAAANDQVRRAQAALDSARLALTTTDATQVDLAALQAAVDQDQAEVARQADALQATHIVSPFDGTVVAVRVKAGDVAVPAKAIVVLARPDAPIVTVDLTDPDPAAARLAVGDDATVAVDSGATPTGPVPAIISAITPPSSAAGARASATVQVSWADGQAPRFGTPVQVKVVLGQVQNVLIVPSSALHQTGGRSTVEVQDGTLRRVITVQVGVSTDAGVEIVSGLTEGQIVLAGPA